MLKQYRFIGYIRSIVDIELILFMLYAALYYSIRHVELILIFGEKIVQVLYYNVS